MEKRSYLTVIEAGKLMGVNPQYIRIGMQRGTLNLGAIEKRGKHYSYKIFPDNLYIVTGVKAEGYHPDKDSIRQRAIYLRNDKL